MGQTLNVPIDDFIGSGSVPETHECSVSEIYFKTIKSGEKKVEGRINHGKFKQFKKFDKLKFYNSNNQLESVICTILDVKQYDNFKDMLIAEGITNCLPGVYNIERGVKIYHNIPGYESRAREYGVLAIRIKLD